LHVERPRCGRRSPHYLPLPPEVVRAPYASVSHSLAFPMSKNRSPTFLRLVPIAAALLIGCSDGVGVLPIGRAVLVTSSEAHELTVADDGAGRVAERTQLPTVTWAAAFSGDSSLLYIAAGDLIAFDSRSRKPRW